MRNVEVQLDYEKMEDVSRDHSNYNKQEDTPEPGAVDLFESEACPDEHEYEGDRITAPLSQVAEEIEISAESDSSNGIISPHTEATTESAFAEIKMDDESVTGRDSSQLANISETLSTASTPLSAFRPTTAPIAAGDKLCLVS
jgi:hypothetical protein